MRVAANSVDDCAGDSGAATAPGTELIAAAEAAAGKPGRGPHFNVAAVALVGVLITAGLSSGAYSLHNDNEDRLLRQRVREAALVASASVAPFQTPLASAALLAEFTNGNPATFRGLMEPIVKAVPLVKSVSLWPTKASATRPLAVVGAQPELASESEASIRAVLGRARGSRTLAINNLLAARAPRVGIAFETPIPQARYIVYAEVNLSEVSLDSQPNAAFSDLEYAVYLGRTADPRDLLLSSVKGGVLHGRRASTSVDFGNARLLVVMSPRTQLGGTLIARLWWMLGAIGLALTLGAATLVGRLTRRRQGAEVLATENAHLYAEQRSVAQTLQHSLLAEAFPEVSGLEFGARYVAGVEGIDIGGDWYDVVRADHGKVLLVVGDVSGRGLEAATMMASLRYAARAYAVEGHSPATILTKLSALASIARDGHFATVLCGSLDIATGLVTVANAGHPAPLLAGQTGAEFVETNIGVPVGVGGTPTYTEVEFAFPRGSTLLLFTDGAIERRGERLDVGMQRLRDVSRGGEGTLEEFLDGIVSGVLADGAVDDTAMLGVRWRM